MIALITYVTLLIGTFVPVARRLLTWAELNPRGPSFEDGKFSPENKKALQQNFARLSGAMRFWKTMAMRYRAFHIYSLAWITISSVAVPVLAQSATADPWSKWLVTAVSAVAAVLLALVRAFRVESNYKAFRKGESDFYDLYRRMLDRPHQFGETEDEQVQRYLEQVEIIRQLVRSAETDNLPSVEEMSQTSPGKYSSPPE
jgi:hypothetical protein